MTLSRRLPPGTNTSFETFSGEPRQRHEELVDLFGQYLFWIRNWTKETGRRLVESFDDRQQLCTILRQPYDEAAQLSPEDRERALQLAESYVDAFIELLLRLFAHRGVDFPLGSAHAVRFRVEMEIVDQETGAIVHEEIVNRGGKKHFADYWGRWLNRHTDS